MRLFIQLQRYSQCPDCKCPFPRGGLHRHRLYCQKQREERQQRGESSIKTTGIDTARLKRLRSLSEHLEVETGDSVNHADHGGGGNDMKDVDENEEIQSDTDESVTTSSKRRNPTTGSRAWANEELVAFINAFERVGKNWSAIAEAVGSRNAKACESLYYGHRKKYEFDKHKEEGTLNEIIDQLQSRSSPSSSSSSLSIVPPCQTITTSTNDSVSFCRARPFGCAYSG